MLLNMAFLDWGTSRIKRGHGTSSRSAAANNELST